MGLRSPRRRKAHHIRPTGPSDIRRIEAGILNWGADITLDTNVYEVGLERLVDDGKPGDYIGRDALRRIKAAGVRRKLAGIEIAGDPIAFNTTKWPVRAGSRPVGHVTSAIHSPRLKRNIGYALVPVEHAADRTRLVVSIPEVGDREATVVPRPFIDPQKGRSPRPEDRRRLRRWDRPAQPMEQDRHALRLDGQGPEVDRLPGGMVVGPALIVVHPLQ